MLDAFVFWLLLEAIGLIGLPFAAALFSRLPGGGLAFARPLGLLLVAYPLWLLVSLDAFRYTRPAAVVAASVAAAAAVAVGGYTLTRIRVTSTARWLWLVGEIVFSACFGLWALVRSFAPDIVQTEKPMDMAIVNSINTSGHFPPHDPWFAGSHLNYYYFGHYIVAFLVRTVGIAPEVGYNLGLALFFALTASAVFAVASALYLALRATPAPVRGPPYSPVLPLSPSRWRAISPARSIPAPSGRARPVQLVRTVPGHPAHCERVSLLQLPARRLTRARAGGAVCPDRARIHDAALPERAACSAGVTGIPALPPPASSFSARCSSGLSTP